MIAQEHLIISTLMTELPPGCRVLAFAPHPDDEIFGCGATLLLLHERGAALSVIVATDGAAGGDNSDGSLSQVRADESRSAARLLGIPEPTFWGYPDRGLVYGESLIERISAAILTADADLLLLPSPAELHPDHQVLALAGAEALRRLKGERRVAFYEVSAPLATPNLLIDITAVAGRKRQAMDSFTSQLQEQPYSIRIAGLNAFRSYTLGAHVESAEAFLLLAADQLDSSLSRWFESVPAHRRRLGCAADTADLPLVSIIVRSMDRSLLGEALDSLALQSYGNIEVLVINAGGGQHSQLPETCGNFPLRIVNQGGERLPRSRAANLGLEAARGDYIGFLDDDDAISPDHIQQLVTAVRKADGPVVAYSGVLGVKRDDPGRLETISFAEPQISFARLLLGNRLPIHAPLFPASLVAEGFRVDEQLDLYEDWDFWLQLTRRLPFVYTGSLTATYFMGGESGVTPRDGSAPDTAAETACNALREKWLRQVGTRELIDISGLYSRATDDALQLTAALEQHSAAHRAELNAERERLTAQRDRLIAERDRRIAELNEELVRRAEWGERLNRQLNDAEARIVGLTSSNSWKVTRPLREFSQCVANPSAQARRYKALLLETLKDAYKGLPISYETRMAHRALLSRYASWLVGDRSGRLPPPIPAPLPAGSELSSVAAAIRLELSPQPRVSIIIPVYGACDQTLRCLASLAAHPAAAPCEIIVVDDCSPDDTAEVLAAVNGIRIVATPENGGFIRACNAGAQGAHGAYLCFLNNDTQVTPGWLDALLRTFEELPSTGLAGSKLLYPDGSLQEAGCIIWQDGAIRNVGRGQDQSLPEFNYAREVDYCSGAALMVPRELFNELNGFDEQYLPAYCEDADLALKIRQRGLRVIYQPLSAVVHYEGGTAGSDLTQGVKSFQLDNSRKLFERWKQQLQCHQINGLDADNAKDRRAVRRVLIIDQLTPAPDRDSGSIDACNLMILLRELDFQVSFIPEDSLIWQPGYSDALQRIGVEMLHAPHCRSVEQHLQQAGGRYDLVILMRVRAVTKHLQTVRNHCPQAKVLFHTVDLQYLRLAREAQLFDDERRRVAAERMKTSELDAIRACDATTVVSSAELEQLRPLLPGSCIRLMPFARAIRGTSVPFAARRDIVFVGGFKHPPNIDAVQYLVGEIMPLVRRRLPGVRLQVVGSLPPPEIVALACDDVLITGYVQQLDELLDTMRISLAPLRYGAGIKGKIGGALAAGLPTVATPLAAEGMSLVDGREILLADTPADFAEAVARLYQDETLWNAISTAGLDCAQRLWGAEAAWETLRDILADLGFSCGSRKYPLRLYGE